VKPIAPLPSQFEVLRRVVAAGFDYAAIKQLCSAALWELVEDEPDLCFVQYRLRMGPEPDDRCLCSIGTSKIDGGPFVYLPLFYFGDDGGDPSEYDRTLFDDAYRNLSETVSLIIGRPRENGTYAYPHRPGWPYSYCTWRLPDSQVFLLQDERDIQFGMDVSLWIFPPETEVPVPIPG
jgi:hypothetical protein